MATEPVAARAGTPRRRARRTRPPLAGVRIVSLAQNLPGPVAVSRLVAAGATAVKIEPPGGDPMRAFSPPWYRELHRRVMVMPLDLKSSAGLARLGALLTHADLLITSQRPSALGRLGITARRLARTHPALRWLSIVGDAADPERPGHDLTYQAQAGLIGAEMPRSLFADLLGAEQTVSAALLLLRREPPCTAVVGLRGALDAARRPLEFGLTTPDGVLGGGRATYRIYETRKGRVAVAALEPHFRDRLHRLLKLSDGADLASALRNRTARAWERWAERHDLPMARILD